MSCTPAAPSTPIEGNPSGSVRHPSVDQTPRGFRLAEDELTPPVSPRSTRYRLVPEGGLPSSPYNTESASQDSAVSLPRDRLAEDDAQTAVLVESSRRRAASGEHASSSPTKKLKVSSKIDDGSKSIGPNPNKNFGKFREWVRSRRGFKADAVKEVFGIWDWQKKGTEQDPQTLDRTEELLRLKGARWLGPKSRAYEMGIKVHVVLDEVMERFGWVQGYGDRDERTGQLIKKYAPANPKHPNTTRLPHFLPFDYVVLDAKDDIVWALQRIRLQSNSGEGEKSGGS